MITIIFGLGQVKDYQGSLLKKKRLKIIQLLDGLITDNITASFKTSTGEMYFAGKGGVNRFHPDSIKINYYKPPVYITDFKLFNKSVTDSR